MSATPFDGGFEQCVNQCGWTGMVTGGGLVAWWNICLEGPHDKPFGVWIGDDVQPAKCRSESI